MIVSIKWLLIFALPGMHQKIMYAALHYRNGEIPNESVIKSTIDYTRYKESQEKALPKFKYYSQCMAELRKILDEEIKPLITVS